MTDDLDDLKAALRALPSADPDVKARAITLAMENFDRLQGSADPARSSEDRHPQAAPLNGVRRMLTYLVSRPALAATTSVAALVIGVAVLLPVADLRLGQTAPPPATAKRQEVPLAQAPVAKAGPEAAADSQVRAEPPTADGAVSSLAETAPEAPETEMAPAPEAELALADDARSIGQGKVAEYQATEPAATVVSEPTGLLPPSENTEAYASAPANPVRITAEEPVSTFSIDVDTASYAVVRSTLGAGALPAPDQVRIEEMINYFPYAYPAPEASEGFRSTVSVMQTPWNPGTRLVTIGLQGALPAIVDRPALNLVFLIDTSGSMDDPMKLGLLKQSLAMMLAELRPEDRIAIVAYAGSAGEVLPPTPASDRATILAALDALAAGGATAGAEGLELAYQVAEGMQTEGSISRILLATDGDFNVGVSDPEGLETYVARKRDTGTYLSVLGFGRGNLDDAVMQTLAQNGNGIAAYIDTLSEARKVLVDQVTGALFPIADDVKIQVEWNPATVAEYRLIGYETRALRREDFNNDAVDAGEIGAGTQVTAIYEVTAPGSDALLNDPLRYGTPAEPGTASELGLLKLRWKAPGAQTSTLIETPITGTEPATDDSRFAAAIAGFGQILQGSVYLGDWGWDDAIAIALSARGADDFGYRIEAINLMRLAQSLDN